LGETEAVAHKDMTVCTKINDSGESAYLGLRHLSPWTIRKIRLALDLGENPDKLQRELEGAKPANADLLPSEMVEFFARSIGDCVRYMVANPSVGVCHNFDGDDRWDWKDG
jgi:hypothetical protein